MGTTRCVKVSKASVIALALSAMLVGLMAPAAANEGQGAEKVWVCKMVGQPGDARPSTGLNPIHVSENSTDAQEAFSDAHPSFVVSGPDDSSCPPGDDDDNGGNGGNGDNGDDNGGNGDNGGDNGNGNGGGVIGTPTEVESLAVEPAAPFTTECLADESLEVSYVLDNSDSKDEVTFTVEVSERGVSEVVVAAGESESGSVIVTPEDGDVIVMIGAEGQLFVDGTFNADECVTPDEDVDVLPDAEEAEPEPVAQGLDRAAEVVSEQASLPDTGVSALLLTLMGLLSLGFGGALLRPRKRD